MEDENAEIEIKENGLAREDKGIAPPGFLAGSAGFVRQKFRGRSDFFVLLIS
jgi:hypothetical protein